ncbi:hypothetical protein PUN28_020927 [Cardiocondyla obscurior]|uniref:Uncharacterized protein n=1 Tax=Cardiocondyla obscurior TaxID=286306 RepID=A0AAW2E6T0_9HYME
MHFLNAAQCYVAKFQKYFFVFGHISAAGKNNRLGIGPLGIGLYASIFVAHNAMPVFISFNCRTMLCYQIKKIFFCFLFISSAGENRKLGINPYAYF